MNDGIAASLHILPLPHLWKTVYESHENIFTLRWNKYWQLAWKKYSRLERNF
mgnify:CR=1 FL=1